MIELFGLPVWFVAGDADAMVTGNTRRYSSSLEKYQLVVDARPGEMIFGLNLVVNRGKTVLIADTAVNEWPNSEQLADIAISSSKLLSYLNGSKGSFPITLNFWSTNNRKNFKS